MTPEERRRIRVLRRTLVGRYLISAKTRQTIDVDVHDADGRPSEALFVESNKHRMIAVRRRRDHP